MVVGICQLTFHLPGNRSLKGKRQVVRKICERIRNRFHVSVAEVGSQDRHQEAKIGVALVSNDARLLNSLLDQILETVELMQLAPVVDRQFEVLHFNDEWAGNTLGQLEDELGWDGDDEWEEEAEQLAGHDDPWSYMDSWAEPTGHSDSASPAYVTKETSDTPAEPVRKKGKV